MLFLGCTTHRLVLVHVLLFQSGSANTATQGGFWRKHPHASPAELKRERLAAGSSPILSLLWGLIDQDTSRSNLKACRKQTAQICVVRILLGYVLCLHSA